MKDKRKQEFYEVYKNKISPKMMQFEPKRKKLILLVILLWLSSGFIFGGSLALLTSHYLLLLPYIFPLVYFVTIPIAISLPIISLFLCKSFKKDLKQKCFRYIIKNFTDLHWKTKTNTILDRDIDKSSLFSAYTNREFDDGFVGSYKGVDFKVSETNLNDGKGVGEEVFKGVIINYKFNKPIKSKTIVTVKHNILICFIYSLIMLLGIVFYIYKTGYQGIFMLIFVIIMGIIVSYKIVDSQEYFELVKLEDPAFGKRFNVYSSDQVEARYLLTPSFMERFYNMKTAFKAKNAKCSFYNDKLMIAFSTNKDLFEICSILRPLSDPRSVQDFYNELSSIYKLIDTFKLDEKTGL